MRRVQAALSHGLAIARPEGASSGPFDGDKEVELLIELWALGLVGARTIRDIAKAAHATAPRPQTLALGSMSDANLHRGLVRKLNLGALNLPEVYKVPLLLWDTQQRPPCKSLVDYPILLPHEYFSCLYNEYPGHFSKYVHGHAPLSEFWRHIPEGAERLAGHPIELIDGFRDNAIPLKIHGDAVPCGRAKGRSLDVISLSSLLADAGATWDTRVYVAGVMTGAKFKGDDTDPGTMESIWAVVMWSLACLRKGTWPATDHLGAPWPAGSVRASKAGSRLCGPHSLPLFAVAADADYLSNYLGLAHFNSVVAPCYRCRCNRADTPWSDFRPTARWRSTSLTRIDYMLQGSKHLLFDSPQVGVTPLHVVIDILHALDLGVLQHVAGSTLYMVAFDAALGGAAGATHRKDLGGLELGL